MLGRITAWAGAIAAGLALIDGVFGGGERLWAIANYAFPPPPDPSYDLKVLHLGYMPDKFEVTGKRSFGIGLSLYNTNRLPVYYEVGTADYSLEDYQNGSTSELPKGRVLPRKVEPVEFSPIYMRFTRPEVYKGGANVIIRYGKNKNRLSNKIELHASILYFPQSRKGRQFYYGLYPNSTMDMNSILQL